MPAMGGARGVVGSAGTTPASLTIPGQSYVPASYGPATTNTRRPVMAMGGAGVAGAVTPLNSDVCQRWGFTIPSTGGAPIARFRLRARNSNCFANTTIAGAITLTGAYIGRPNVAAATTWAGNFTTAPTSLGLSTTVEMGTSEYVSPWISPSTLTLAPNTFYGLSVGLTCAGVQLNKDTTPGWAFVGTGSAAAASAAATPGTTAQPYTNYMDWRLEYEFAGTNQIGFFLGDSIMSGDLVTTTPAVGQMGTNNTWPQQAALRLGHHAMNGGVGSSWSASFTAAPATVLAYSRFFAPESGNTTFASTPDYGCIALGVNDGLYMEVFGQTIANIQNNFQSMYANFGTIGIQRIYQCTATQGFTGLPAANILTAQSGQLSTALAGAFVAITVANVRGPGYATGQPGAAACWYQATQGPTRCYVGTPNNPVAGGGPLTITGAAGGSGSTLTLTVAGTITAPVGTPVLTGWEYNRKNINLYIRNFPPGIQAVIDFDADVMTQFYDPSSTGRTEYYNNSGENHPTTPAMYGLMASRFVNGILGN